VHQSIDISAAETVDLSRTNRNLQTVLAGALKELNETDARSHSDVEGHSHMTGPQQQEQKQEEDTSSARGQTHVIDSESESESDAEKNHDITGGLVEFGYDRGTHTVLEEEGEENELDESESDGHGQQRDDDDDDAPESESQIKTHVFADASSRHNGQNDRDRDDKHTNEGNSSVVPGSNDHDPGHAVPGSNHHHRDYENSDSDKRISTNNVVACMHAAETRQRNGDVAVAATGRQSRDHDDTDKHNHKHDHSAPPRDHHSSTAVRASSSTTTTGHTSTTTPSENSNNHTSAVRNKDSDTDKNSESNDAKNSNTRAPVAWTIDFPSSAVGVSGEAARRPKSAGVRRSFGATELQQNDSRLQQQTQRAHSASAGSPSRDRNAHMYTQHNSDSLQSQNGAARGTDRDKNAHVYTQHNSDSLQSQTGAARNTDRVVRTVGPLGHTIKVERLVEPRDRQTDSDHDNSGQIHQQRGARMQTAQRPSVSVVKKQQSSVRDSREGLSSGGSRDALLARDAFSGGNSDQDSAHAQAGHAKRDLTSHSSSSSMKSGRDPDSREPRTTHARHNVSSSNSTRIGVEAPGNSAPNIRAKGSSTVAGKNSAASEADQYEDDLTSGHAVYASAESDLSVEQILEYSDQVLQQASERDTWGDFQVGSMGVVDVLVDSDVIRYVYVCMCMCMCICTQMCSVVR
jgi:hypothetical protein